jgi:hypothetical protein
VVPPRELRGANPQVHIDLNEMHGGTAMTTDVVVIWLAE